MSSEAENTGKEAEKVVAEVIEEQEASSLSVSYAPSTIEANFDALEKHVRKTVELYKGATYDLTKADKIKEAKNDRTYLNGLKNEIEERRKAVKREYNKPLAAFEKRCKEITAIIDEAADGIKAQIDQAEEDRKARARAKLEEHYETFAGLLAPVVPYERFHEKQWLNKNFGEVKAKKALEASRALFSGEGDDTHMPTTELADEDVPADGIGIADLMLKCGLAASKGEARRLIQQGGVALDGEKVSAVDLVVEKARLKEGVKIKKGKKVFHKAIIK